MNPNDMCEDALGDWRHWAVTTLAQDVPAVYPGGPSHKAGAPVYLSSLTRDVKGQIIGFTMPSPIALALSVSIQSARRADDIRRHLQFENHVSPFGTVRSVPIGQTSELYDFFEECMITVTFSFNALELFSNQTIAEKLKEPYVRTTKRGQQRLTPEAVQNDLPLEDKLTNVLPSVLATGSPKEIDAWKDFERLKRARHATIHMKPSHAYSQQNIDRETLFYEFFSQSSLTSFPRLAIEIVGFYRKDDEVEQRWLRGARNLLAS